MHCGGKIIFLPLLVFRQLRQKKPLAPNYYWAITVKTCCIGKDSL